MLLVATRATGTTLQPSRTACSATGSGEVTKRIMFMSRVEDRFNEREGEGGRHMYIYPVQLAIVAAAAAVVGNCRLQPCLDVASIAPEN